MDSRVVLFRIEFRKKRQQIWLLWDENACLMSPRLTSIIRAQNLRYPPLHILFPLLLRRRTTERGDNVAIVLILPFDANNCGI